MNRTWHDAECDVAILGGGIAGAINALTLRQRGLRTVVLEARDENKPQKLVVGEAVTEGTSLFLRHELGLEPWFEANTYRKFGFDFVILPDGGAARTIEDCHELLLSQVPLERIPAAFRRLIPTYHVERPALDREITRRARAAGAAYRYGATVERVDLAADEAPHTIHYRDASGSQRLTARWVLDCSGRRALLGRQLGLQQSFDEPTTAAVWNRFEGVAADPSLWRTFQGIDRRRQTIHFSGPGFWIWWIHQSDRSTSVGVTWDKTQHNPLAADGDHGFWAMMKRFPPILPLLAGAEAKEPYQSLAHLPYRSEHWVSPRRYALIGDAGWFVDALYSIGLETTCRETVLTTHAIERDRDGAPLPAAEFAAWNREFDFMTRAVSRLNAFKYRHAWHRPYLVAQTVIYETAEIAALYHLQRREQWTYEQQRKYYSLQWSSQARLDHLDRFLAESLTAEGRRPYIPGLLKKALIPDEKVYRVTWPLWNIDGMTPYFFRLIRAWAIAERQAQMSPRFPDVLGWMARGWRLRGAAGVTAVD